MALGAILILVLVISCNGMDGIESLRPLALEILRFGILRDFGCGGCIERFVVSLLCNV